ncbi:hypothetical protein NUU61_004270 [Penicillium alfredii]|uniref:Uncharacterized protein n=1 Tax=Penicillium alfredii TaxID=1506179 RepID=A0A9W9FKY5_9EURO|nr:uncharacterized protein NUU61_004270 [Penicillium alfredii]KAJ5102048.1 hypothetical protein NUU61_004270 [Penicillium alfredii]
MSFLPPLRSASRRTLQSTTSSPSFFASSSATFHTSAVRSSLKETDKNRDDLPNFYEAQKEDQVKNSKEGKAKWKAELASNSEADVKADRGEIESDDATFEALQDRTKHLPNRKGPVNKTQ